MRKTDSFYDFERLIYQESIMKWKEKIFLTNGRLFMEVGINGTSEGVNVNLEKESEFLEEYQGIFIYSYHTHIKNIHLNGYPKPPSFDDFCADKSFRKRAKKKKKRIISRIIEKNGIWQYAHTSEILPPINLDQMIQHEIEYGRNLNERINKLIKSYKIFGISEIKFSKRRF